MEEEEEKEEEKEKKKQKEKKEKGNRKKTLSVGYSRVFREIITKEHT